MKKQLTFRFVDSELDAQLLAQHINKQASAYMRKHHPASYSLWVSEDRKEHKFIVWFYQ